MKSKFRLSVLLSLLSSLSILAQPPSTGGAETKGICSPANTGNNNTFNFTCTGLSPEQQRLLASVPELLNKLLASQAGSVSEILSKLDTCIAQGAARHLSASQKDLLDSALEPFRGQTISVSIYSSMKESNDFGEEMIAALGHAGLKVDASSAISANPVTGFLLEIGPGKDQLANAVARTLIDAGLGPRPIPAIRSSQSGSLTLTVGFKP